MDFYAVVDQAVALLKTRGRVSYRALRQQFSLDDDRFDALRTELLYAHADRVREDGHGLVWAVDHQGERRQLTMFFCDLVGSTTLASRFDPEEWREIVASYYDACAKVIARFDGHIAQYLGDGVLVYFGYPRAHEDDAQRAVRAGLAIIDAVGQLNTVLSEKHGVSLAVRLGCHTGLVVVGDEVAGTGHDDIVLGDTPNIAARLQGVAEPNTLVVGELTHQLLGNTFTYESLGTPSLKGVATPLRVYRVLYESTARTRLEALASAGLTPLVGRDTELQMLEEAWSRVVEGDGEAVLVTGEAGIGKSRLVKELTEHASADQAWFTHCQCSPYHQHTALYPLIDLLERIVLRLGPADSPSDKLAKLEGFLVEIGLPLGETAPLFCSLLSIPLGPDYEAPSLPAEQLKQQTLHALLEIPSRRAEKQPVMLIVEDLHWVDPSTLEFLTLLLQRIGSAPILAVFTGRPEFDPPWGQRSDITRLDLKRLPPDAAGELTHQVAQGKKLPAEVMTEVVSKTDGVPLFIEELTKMLLESGLLEERRDHYTLTGPLPPLAIPNTLQDSLMARLDRLAPVKGVAQLGATLGREFSYRLLQAVSPWDDDILQRGLEQLVAAEFFYQSGAPPDATFRFKHALIQDVAYQSLLKSTRQHHHRRIATTLESQFPETAESQPELLAHHYTEAGLVDDAVPYWHAAASRALHRHATREAISHATRGLELLATLPDTPRRDRRELSLQQVLAPALSTVNGPHSVEHIHARAYELARELGDVSAIFPALSGMAYAKILRGQLREARALAEEHLGLAEPLQDALVLAAGHWMLAYAAWWQGDVGDTLLHSKAGLARYNADQHLAGVSVYNQNPGIVCGYLHALANWVLGYPAQAATVMENTLIHAKELRHPYSVAIVLMFSAQLAQLRREPEIARIRAEDALQAAEQVGSPALALWCLLPRGWALAQQGDLTAGVADIQEGMARRRAFGMGAVWPWFLALVAEVYGALGQIGEGLAALDEALDWVQRNDERLYAAEVHRIRGELLLRQAVPDPPQAEACFQQALTVARDQNAKSWELRAATSLARIWLQDNRLEDARALLCPVYEWFTEGFDTADLQDAKALLDQLL